MNDTITLTIEKIGSTDGFWGKLSLLINFILSSPAATVGTIAALSTALFATITIHSNRKADRIKNSLDFEKTFKHTKEMFENSEDVRQFLISSKEKPDELFTSCYKTGTNPEAASDLAKLLTKQLNEWERCSNGCATKSYNERFLFGVYGTVVITIFEKLVPFILSRQSASYPTMNYALFDKLSWLALKWKMRKSFEKFEFPEMRLLIAYWCLNMYHKQVCLFNILRYAAYPFTVCTNILFKITNVACAPFEKKHIKYAKENGTIYHYVPLKYISKQTLLAITHRLLWKHYIEPHEALIEDHIADRKLKK